MKKDDIMYMVGAWCLETGKLNTNSNKLFA
jgi:hypothetical protein